MRDLRQKITDILHEGCDVVSSIDNLVELFEQFTTPVQPALASVEEILSACPTFPANGIDMIECERMAKKCWVKVSNEIKILIG